MCVAAYPGLLPCATIWVCRIGVGQCSMLAMLHLQSEQSCHWLSMLMLSAQENTTAVASSSPLSEHAIPCSWVLSIASCCAD